MILCIKIFLKKLFLFNENKICERLIA